MDNRNPYVLLGLPFGASREAALAAFARKSRHLRRQGAAGRALTTDLTWALSQVSQSEFNADAVMGLYRIPANPQAFAPQGKGVLQPDADPAPRRYCDVDGAEESLRRRAAREYLRYLVLLSATHAQPVQP